MKKAVSIFILLSFALGQLKPQAFAQEAFITHLPKPGQMVALSPSYDPPMLKGIKVYPNNPMRLDFILDQGDGKLDQSKLKETASKLSRYFLAGMTVPEDDLWVNLSPYESARIVPAGFGRTEMGQDLLAEDYLLKQITATLMSPEGKIGKAFWQRIYSQAASKYKQTQIPIDSFNKVWIVPDKVTILEDAQNGTAVIQESTLKLMMQEDYLSLNHHQGQGASSHALASQLMREIIIPELTKEINEGKNFASLRQAYQSLILARWYKEKISGSILTNFYADHNKVKGIDLGDPAQKEKIYTRYLQAFKKGVYNNIRQERDPQTQAMVARKYFLGGCKFKFTDFKVVNATPAMVASFLKQGIKHKVFYLTAVLSLVFKSAFAQFSSDQDSLPSDYDDPKLQAIFTQATNDNPTAVEQLGKMLPQGNEDAADALFYLLNNTKNGAAKQAFTILKTAPLSAFTNVETVVRFVELQKTNVVTRVHELIDAKDLEAAYEYLCWADVDGSDPYAYKAIQLLQPETLGNFKYRNLNSVLEKFYNDNKLPTLSREIIKQDLIALTYAGDIYAYELLIRNKFDPFTQFDPEKLRKVSDFPIGRMLLELYPMNRDPKYIRQTFEFLFDDNDHRTKFDFQYALTEEIVAAAKVLVTSEEIQKRDLPLDPEAVKILARLGLPKARAAYPDIAQYEDKKMDQYEAYQGIEGGDKPYLMEYLKKLDENKQADAIIDLFVKVSSMKLLEAVRQELNEFFANHVDVLINGFNLMYWQGFITDEEKKPLIPAIKKLAATNFKAFVLSVAAGNRDREDFAKYPPSAEVFKQIGNYPIAVALFKGYLDLGYDFTETFKMMETAYPGLMYNLLVSWDVNVKVPIRDYLKQVDISGILPVFANDRSGEEKFIFLVQATLAQNPQAAKLLAEYCQQSLAHLKQLLDANADVFLPYGLDLGSNPDIKAIGQHIDISLYAADKSTDEYRDALWGLIQMGNSAALEEFIHKAQDNEQIASRLDLLFSFVPSELTPLIKNYDVTNLNPDMQKAFAFHGNEQARAILLKGMAQSRFNFEDITHLNSFEDAGYAKLVKESNDYLTLLRLKGIDDFKSRIKGMDAKSTNLELRDLYLAVLIDMQQKWHYFGIEDFKQIAQSIILRMNVSVNYLNANSHFEFGYALLDEMTTIDHLLYVVSHEIGHNILEAHTVPIGPATSALGFSSVHEYFADMIAFSYLGDPNRIKFLIENNFLDSGAAAVKTEGDYKRSVEEPHYIDRTTTRLFIVMAQKRGIDPYPILASMMQSHLQDILAYGDSYEEFDRYFYFTLAKTVGVNPKHYDAAKDIKENLKQLMDEYKKANNLALNSHEDYQLRIMPVEEGFRPYIYYTKSWVNDAGKTSTDLAENNGGIDLRSMAIQVEEHDGIILFHTTETQAKACQSAIGIKSTIYINPQAAFNS